MIPKFTVVLIDPDRYAVYDGDGELYAGGDQSELPSTLADGLGAYEATIMTVVSVDADNFAPPIPETIDELIERCFDE